MKYTVIVLVIIISVIFIGTVPKEAEINYTESLPFGNDTHWAKASDNSAIGEWWNKSFTNKWQRYEKLASKWFNSIDRKDVMAFGLYTHDHNILKITGQCFPLLPDEPKSVTLEFMEEGQWKEKETLPVLYPGWSVHFRVENWDNTRDVRYRLRLGNLSSFEGLIRKDPIDKDKITIAVATCNSPNDDEFDTRLATVAALKNHDPDVLFFGGDQNYTHDEATYGWLQFGVQFSEVIKDRPTIVITDDHDIGHGNLWGEAGAASAGISGAADGGYMFPASFVNMVERQQCWNLPDPFDPTPVKQGIRVYYTDLNVGGVSFAILEDRKFKSAPIGKIPQMGPRPDHIDDPTYDRAAVDLPGLQLLGDRQLKFLDEWSRDWTDAEIKVALSATAFCGAVHVHGNKKPKRLLADLDCNGWPQTGRNSAIKALRRARAFHLCGDQHLGVSLQHGVESFRDGPFAFTVPAIVNTVYGRWWHPLDEKMGGGEIIDSSLPWVGDYEDGLGNKITMHAYANPQDRSIRAGRGDGYGIVHMNKSTGLIDFECWPRFADVTKGDSEQYEGWPISFHISENDGRKPIRYMDEVKLPFNNSVIELTDDLTGELIYCYRVKGEKFSAPIFREGSYTLKAGLNRADRVILKDEIN